jgi:hypothetical protein
MGRKVTRAARYYLSTIVGIVAFLLLLPILVPLLLVMGAYSLLKSMLLVWQFRRAFGAEGKIGVLVYSDSPNWKEYVESQILPCVAARLVTVNWSRRSEWTRPKPLEVRVFEHWAGSREFNPIAIIVRGYGRVQTVRFFAAFKAHKHGKSDDLRAAEDQLFRAVEAA